MSTVDKLLFNEIIYLFSYFFILLVIHRDHGNIVIMEDNYDGQGCKFFSVFFF